MGHTVPFWETDGMFENSFVLGVCIIHFMQTYFSLIFTNTLTFKKLGKCHLISLKTKLTVRAKKHILGSENFSNQFLCT